MLQYCTEVKRGKWLFFFFAGVGDFRLNNQLDRFTVQWVYTHTCFTADYTRASVDNEECTGV